MLPVPTCVYIPDDMHRVQCAFEIGYSLSNMPKGKRLSERHFKPLSSALAALLHILFVIYSHLNA